MFRTSLISWLLFLTRSTSSFNSECQQFVGNFSLRTRSECIVDYALLVCPPTVQKDGPRRPQVHRFVGNLTTRQTKEFLLTNDVPFTTCWREQSAFVSFTSQDTRSAFDFDRFLNKTTGAAFFRADTLFAANVPGEQYTLSLYFGGGMTIEKQLSSAIISNPLYENESTCADFNDVVSGGYWHRNSSDPINGNITFKKNDDGHAWSWIPRSCHYQPQAMTSIMNEIRQGNLSDLLLVGTSRTRTLYYDTILHLEPDAQFVSSKWHGNLKHFFPHLNLTLHFHFLNCEDDIVKGTHVLNGYFNTIKHLHSYLKSNGLCRFSRFKCQAANGTDQVTRKQVVVFATSICEAKDSKACYFEEHIMSLMNYLKDVCHNTPAPPSSTPQLDPCRPDSTIIVKSEESLDPWFWFYNAAKDLNHHLQRLILTEKFVNGSIVFPFPYLDTFHVTRSFKIFNDSHDGLHFYSLSRQYVGNNISKTVAQLILSLIACVLKKTSVECTDNARTSEIPHTQYSFGSKSDGTVMKLSDKRNKSLFYLLSGSKHVIPNWDTFVALGLEWTDIVEIEMARFNEIPSGDDLPALSL